MLATTAIGWLLIAALASASLYTGRADTLSCDDAPPGLTALTFAGDRDVALRLLEVIEEGCPGEDIVGRLKSTIRHDGWLIAAYGITLTYWLTVGSWFIRRDTRRSVVQRLARSMPLAVIADVLNSLFLWQWLDDQDQAAWLTAATLTAWLKWSIVVPALLIGIRLIVDVSSRATRALVFGDRAIRPSFWEGANPSVPDFEEPLSERSPSEQRLARHCAPSDGLWPLDDARPIGVAFSGGGIRAAAYCLGALQTLVEPARTSLQHGDSINTVPIEQVRYLATVSGGGFIGGAFQAMARMQNHTGAEPGSRLPFTVGSPEAEHLLKAPHYLWPSVAEAGPARSTREFLHGVSSALAGIAFNIAVVAAIIFSTSHGVGFASREFLFAAWTSRDVPIPTLGGVGLAGVSIAAALSLIIFFSSITASLRGYLRDNPRKVWLSRLIAVFAVGPAGAILFAVVLTGDIPPRWPIKLAAIVVVGSLVLVVAEQVNTVFVGVLNGISLRAHLLPALTRYGPGAALSVAAGWLMVHWYVGARDGGWGAPMNLRPLALVVIALTAGIGSGVLVTTILRLRSPLNSSLHPKAAYAQVLLGGAIGFTLAWIALSGVGQSATGGTFATGRIWLVVSMTLLLVNAFADQKRWSPHPFYKRRLASKFCLYRPKGDDEAAATVPYRVNTALSDWAAPQPGLPELIICAASYDSYQKQFGLSAKPFTFGSSYVGSTDVGWVRTVDFEAALGRGNQPDATLLGAMAISGAAVSPAIGSVDVGTAGSLLSLLNARLGVWLPSPRYVEQMREPTDSPEGSYPLWVRTRRLTYLLRELTGHYDPADRFLYVTDGGQYDNLGVFALLQRRCPIIIAFDASGDLRPAPPGCAPSCDAFQQTRALAEDQLGVTFKLLDDNGAPCRGDSEQTSPVGPVGEPGTRANPSKATRPIPTARASIARFEVSYPAELGEQQTTLLILAKAVISDNTSSDLRDYAGTPAGKGFPADSTLNQFLEPQRFEKYVELGRENAKSALAAAQPESITEPQPTTPSPAPESPASAGWRPTLSD